MSLSDLEDMEAYYSILDDEKKEVVEETKLDEQEKVLLKKINKMKRVKNLRARKAMSEKLKKANLELKRIKDMKETFEN